MWAQFSLLIFALIQLVRADECKDTKPDFSAPGRRISEQKCYEFNWERKHIEKCSKDAANTDYPYVGAIGYRRDGELSFICGAFLISPKHAVTAAHCIKVAHSSYTPEFIRFGNKDFEADDHVDVKILNSIVHPEYKPPMSKNDLAVVELESEVPFSKSVQPACLWSKETLEGAENPFTPGWLRTRSGKRDTVISELKVKVMDAATCVARIQIHKLVRLEDNQLCVNETLLGNRECEKTPITSPLIAKVNLGGKAEDQMPVAFAMASFGQRCGSFGVYSRIYSFLDWIEQSVWK